MSNGASGKAIAALVCGIAGLFMCPILAIVAIIVRQSAQTELRNGLASPEGEGLARAGIIPGWVSIALFVLGILGYICLGAGILGLGTLS